MAEHVAVPKITSLMDLEDRGWTMMTDTDTGKVEPYLRCPGCGILAAMTRHDIAADGAVTPSILCPESCGYHVHGKLDGWEDGEMKGAG